MPGLVNYVCKISADFPPSCLNSSPQGTCTLQKCSQKFSFFTVFHYRKLTKRHCKQINLNPDWFFCYHDTIFMVRTKLKIFVQRFFFSLVYIFVVFAGGVSAMQSLECKGIKLPLASQLDFLEPMLVRKSHRIILDNR